MNRKLSFAVLAMVFALSMILAACGSGNNNNNGNAGGADSDTNNTDSNNDDNNNNGGTADLGNENITIPNVNWAGAEARAHLLKAVLEDVGYSVDVKDMEAGPMFASVSKEDNQFTAAYWLPATHKQYEEKYGDKIEEISGGITDKAPLSLTVPKYMVDKYDLHSIEDMKGNDELIKDTDGKITGIDSGAGIMAATDQALKDYKLDEWKNVSSSEGAMMAELKKKYNDKEAIIVTGWKPHYMFAQYDLVLLEDPKTSYGDTDHISIGANKGLKDASPAAYKVLQNYTEDEDQLNELMGKIYGEDKEDPDDAAKEYMEDHPDKVKEWEKGVK